MENLTLVIPAKFEATTLPIVLKEIKDLNLCCKKIVVVPTYITYLNYQLVICQTQYIQIHKMC